ncbi:flocculation-associated PEP-CTERM protein PepA [Noviherbaspirillum pedocola]|uniref:Flocculation-associated PEP-CTERM protein PepA n=1 Tax=Noviherbaspirillum pedocola TaxID=2801341 RepID=A0A934W0K6_9BURK|nr:flocculation-associated PEP-CTERM protein PepA [Noviherbaspirillum pedocola]MBK4734216.1 flocculation-associated PEP-CTERM protein PepA [Noviherbaspirillum pedocola]
MFKKILVSTIAASAMALGFSTAQATPLMDFEVSDGGTPFTADKIVGGYQEIITLNTNGTFNVALKWTADGFYANDGATPVTSNLKQTYNLYALYTASGVYSNNGFGYSFDFSPNTGSLVIYKDPTKDTGFTAPATGSGSFTTSNSSDDVKLADGVPVSGSGLLINLGNSNAGSFGATQELSLTPDGASYFTKPVPFYGLTLQSGQFNSNFAPGQTVAVNGSLDVTFDVPEPGMVGLLGLGMLAAAVSRRKGVKRTFA